MISCMYLVEILEEFEEVTTIAQGSKEEFIQIVDLAAPGSSELCK